jgi:transposase-like protein
MKRLAEKRLDCKKKKGKLQIVTQQEMAGMEVDARVEMIRTLIPLGMMKVSEMLEEEVCRLAGERYSRAQERKIIVRHGSNSGSVYIGGIKTKIKVPRVRERKRNQEIDLETYQKLKEPYEEINDVLLKRVLYGISCNNYKEASEHIPGALGLSSSTVSQRFIEASSKKLKELQERDLSKYDIAALILDGKRFGDDMLIMGLGVTIEGKKIALGFVEAGSEHSVPTKAFLEELIERGLKIETGLLVVTDGSKGLIKAVRTVFGKKAVNQRCQWHKRENIVSYLPKQEQAYWRGRLQRAYNKPTYEEAKAGLDKIHRDLEKCNMSAVKSMEEGFEETLTLHRLGIYALIGHSLKTTNCLESINSAIERRCGKVTYWKNSSQKQRWLATALLDIEPRLQRIRGYKHLPMLRAQLQGILGISKKQAAA